MGNTAPEWKGYDHQLFQDKKLQSYSVPNSEKTGCSPIIRNLNSKEGFVGYLKAKDTEEKQKEIELDTAWKLYSQSVKDNGNNAFIGYRKFLNEKKLSERGKFEWMTYNEFNTYVYAYGNGLRSLDLDEKAPIGIYSINRPEWYAMHIANLSQSYKTVALYDTLGAQAVKFIIEHAELPVIVCEKNKLKALFEAISNREDNTDNTDNTNQKETQEEKSDTNENNTKTDELNFKLKYIIQIDYNERYGNKHETVSDEDKETAKKLGVTLLGLSELYKKGENNNKCVSPSKDDTAYIMYTSGTTGNPKGVILSHQCFASMVASGSRIFNMKQSDIHLSYLPLAHIFEAMCQQIMASAGGKIGYFQGDIRKISLDWLDIRPTILIGVPRVFNKTYDKFKMKMKDFNVVKKWLVESAEKSSQTAIRQGERSNFYDKHVWSEVPKTIGFDRVRWLISGAAPLPPHIAEFLRIILPKAKIVQGYGMTESTAGGTITDSNDYTLGHVGVPVDNIEIRLVDAPECGYKVIDKPHPRGEIQLRGLSIMDGYYKNPIKTSETLLWDNNKDKENNKYKQRWLATGDIGRINPNGTISIIDRRKNMFKTSLGEYIASEKVEAVYSKASSIGQMYVYGNSYKSFIVAIIVPDVEVSMSLLKNQGIIKEEIKSKPGTQEYSDLFMKYSKTNESKKFLKDAIVKEMSEYEKTLKKFERVKDIYLELNVDNLMQGFNVENNCLTPTFKLKRPQLKARYMNQIKQMYSDNGDPPKETENWS